ncbi:MAG: SpoIIIAH-like family protein [Oscillospiraceae bacterium]
MKANMIIGKKQIILASLVLMLGVAVYLNWQFANSDGGLDITGELEANATPSAIETDANTGQTSQVNGDAEQTTTSTTDETQTSTSGEKKLGDSQLVNAATIASDNYFAKAKLTKTRSRDESMQTISTLLGDTNLSDEQKSEATQKAIDISQAIEVENKIENLVKAKGFSECIVFLNKDNVNVVVKTNGLEQKQATQIKNIVLGQANVPGNNISIIEVK